MVWLKLDDKFPDHPKVTEAGPLAAWLHVCGMAFCSRYLTDGFIPARQVSRLADLDNADDLVKTLVRVGLWEEADGGFRVHDFLEYNPSAEQVKRKRAAAAKRQADWRARQNVTHSVTNGVTGALVTPAPSRPDPSPIDKEEAEAAQYTEIVKFCESMFGIRNELLQQYINERVDEYGLILTLWAVQTAYEANARTWRYIDVCLENKKKEADRGPPGEVMYYDPFMQKTVAIGEANAGKSTERPDG